MSKTVACIIARTVSTRLPLKVLRTVAQNLSLVEYIILRLKAVNAIDDIYICTSKNPVDDILIDVAKKHSIKYYQGSEGEVIHRMVEVGEISNADNLIRITGDNVFTATEYIDKQIKLLEKNKLDYIRLVDVPIGTTAEVMTFEALKKCYKIIDRSVSEYLMLYLFEPNNFSCGIIKPFKENFENYTLTVDTKEDLERTKELFERFNYKRILDVQLNELTNILKEEKILNSTIKLNGQIKYPYGKLITFKEYIDDMNRRKKGSVAFNL